MSQIVIAGIVRGAKPKTQGSVSPIAYRKKNGKLGVNVFQNKDLLHWRDLVVASVLEHTGNKVVFPKGTPVTVKLTFKFEKPKSVKGKYPVTRSSGDIDKLIRAVLDAFTQANVYDDDSQVVYVISDKIYVDSEEEIGVDYQIIEYEE